MKRPGSAFGRELLVGVALLAVVLLLAGLVPRAPLPSTIQPAVNMTGVHPTADVVTAVVTFQGIPVSAHTTPGSAITATFGSNFLTIFTWSSPGVATLVTSGQLSVLFLGASLGSSSEQLSGAVPALNGTITLNSVQFGTDKYLFEGIYELRASLFDQGTALWNTTFYVWVQAPYHLTVINIALILIAIFEVYQIIALGSARIARKQLGLSPTKDPGEV